MYVYVSGQTQALAFAHKNDLALHTLLIGHFIT